MSYILVCHLIDLAQSIYFDRIKSGILSAFEPLVVEHETPGTALVNGNMGLGLYIGL